MPMIAVPVSIWVSGGAAAVAATGITAAGALAGAVAAGIVTGAVIGAATALITGGDILKGALMGAVVGGVSAGIMSGLSGGAAAAGGSEAVAAPIEAGGGGLLNTTAPITTVNTAAGLTTADPMYGAAMAGEITPATGILSAPALDVNPAGKGGKNVLTQATTQPVVKPATPTQPVVKPVIEASGESWYNKLWSGMSPEVKAGIIKGAGSALGKVGSSMIEADSAKDLEEWKSNEERRKITANQVSTDYQKRVANITLPQLWKNYAAVNTKVTV